METPDHKPRVEFSDANPRIYPLMRELTAYLDTSSIDARLRDLIKVRASQINGCAFCLDMHVREALAHGESHDRLHLVCAWREAPHFTDAEKAALELAEAVTLIAAQGVSNALYERVRQHYSAEQYVDLLTAINVINSWNRYMISMGHTPPLRSSAHIQQGGRPE